MLYELIGFSQHSYFILSRFAIEEIATPQCCVIRPLICSRYQLSSGSWEIYILLVLYQDRLCILLCHYPILSL